jgi:hypothetical protein
MLSWQEEMREREQVQENDRRVREQQQKQQQGTTMQQFAQSQADEISQGRFAATGIPNVTGATEIPYSSLAKMPASSPWSGAQPQPPIEPPLNYEINRLTPYELEPSMPHPIEDPADVSPVSPSADPGPTSDPAPSPEHPPPPGDEQRPDVGPSSSSEGSDNA